MTDDEKLRATVNIAHDLLDKFGEIDKLPPRESGIDLRVACLLRRMTSAQAWLTNNVNRMKRLCTERQPPGGERSIDLENVIEADGVISVHSVKIIGNYYESLEDVPLADRTKPILRLRKSATAQGDECIYMPLTDAQAGRVTHIGRGDLLMP